MVEVVSLVEVEPWKLAEVVELVIVVEVGAGGGGGRSGSCVLVSDRYERSWTCIAKGK